MRIKILHDVKGSPDGIRVYEFLKGETYDVPSRKVSLELSGALIQAGYAKSLSSQDVKPPETAGLKPKMEYASLKVPELQEIAGKLGIEYKGLKKDDLIAAITAAHSNLPE